MSVGPLATVEVMLPDGASLSFVAGSPFDFVRERILHEHDVTLAYIVAEDENAASYSDNCHVPPGAYKAVLTEEARSASWSFSSWISSPVFEEHRMTLQLLVYAEPQQTSGSKHKHINRAKVWKLANMLRLRGEIQRIRTSVDDQRAGSACRLLLQGTARLAKIFIRACTQDKRRFSIRHESDVRLVSDNSLLSVVLENRGRTRGAGTAYDGGPPEPGFRVARQPTDKAELWTEDDLPGWDEDGEDKVRRKMTHTIAPPAGPAPHCPMSFFAAHACVACPSDARQGVLPFGLRHRYWPSCTPCADDAALFGTPQDGGTSD